MKLPVSIILFTLLFLGVFSSVYAASCPKDDPCRDIGNVNEKVTCYTNVVNTCSAERQNMHAQVVYLSTKVELTKSKIDSYKNKISSLEDEIGDISGKIDNLENSLTRITGLFLDRITASYKFRGYPVYNIIFTSRGLSEFVKRYKYVQTVQNHDRKLLFQLQNSKVNFQEQKTLREDKKTELADLKIQLEKEEKMLASQKKGKGNIPGGDKKFREYL